MSNNAVGNVYKTIIDEVIEAARVDFEENGVDEGVLEELRKVNSFPIPSRSPFTRTSNPHTCLLT